MLGTTLLARPTGDAFRDANLVTDAPAVRVLWFANEGVAGESLLVSGCRFTADADALDRVRRASGRDYVSSGILTLQDSSELENWLTVRACTFARELDIGLEMDRGGSWYVSSSRPLSPVYARLGLTGTASGKTRRATVRFESVSPHDHAVLALRECLGSSLAQADVVIPTSASATVVESVEGLMTLGGRTVFGRPDPGRTPGLVGDRYVRTPPRRGWIHAWEARATVVEDGIVQRGDWLPRGTIGAR